MAPSTTAPSYREGGPGQVRMVTGGTVAGAGSESRAGRDIRLRGGDADAGGSEPSRADSEESAPAAA